MRTIEEEIMDIACFELGLEGGAISLASPLSELGDSLDWINLLGAVETAFELRIGIDESLALATLGDLVRWVQLRASAAKEQALA